MLAVPEEPLGVSEPETADLDLVHSVQTVVVTVAMPLLSETVEVTITTGSAVVAVSKVKTEACPVTDSESPVGEADETEDSLVAEVGAESEVTGDSLAVAEAEFEEGDESLAEAEAADEVLDNSVVVSEARPEPPSVEVVEATGTAVWSVVVSEVEPPEPLSVEVVEATGTTVWSVVVSEARPEPSSVEVVEASGTMVICSVGSPSLPIIVPVPEVGPVTVCVVTGPMGIVDARGSADFVGATVICSVR